MRGMTLHLRQSSGYERFDGLTSFVGEDASGSFGLLPGHAWMMTALAAGLARFRVGEGEWHYLALPGGILSAAGGELTLCTRRYLLDTDFRRMGKLLAGVQRAEEETMGGIRESLPPGGGDAPAAAEIEREGTAKSTITSGGRWSG
jgi:F-type H+-transporting ATPase subunit epsilon